MKDQFENDEWDQYLEESYIKEAERIEKELFPEGEVQEADLSEEEVRVSYEKLTNKMKRYGDYSYMRDRENIGKPTLFRRRYPLDRVAAAIIFAALGVLITSLSSQANREEFLYRIRYMTSVTAEELPVGEAIAEEEITEDLASEKFEKF